MVKAVLLNERRNDIHEINVDLSPEKNEICKILDSLDELDEPEKDFELFTEFLKNACRFRPQDVPWK